MDFFKKLFKSKKRKKRGKLKRERHAAHDWVTALIVLFIEVAIIVAVSGFVFLSVQDIEITEQEVTSDITKLIDNDLLKETIDTYTARDDNFSSYKRRAPVAPSI